MIVRAILAAIGLLGGVHTATATAPAVRAPQLEAPPSSSAPAGPCAEWAELAAEVGWPRELWPTLADVMWCESRCDPGAANPSGAAGLLQVMPMWWRGRDPHHPATNLAIGLEVWERQGWWAWSCYPTA